MIQGPDAVVREKIFLAFLVNRCWSRILDQNVNKCFMAEQRVILDSKIRCSGATMFEGLLPQLLSRIEGLTLMGLDFLELPV